MVDRADWLVLSINPHKPTYRSTHELVQANLQRKPVIVQINDISTMPIWYCGLIDFDLVFETFDEVIECVRRVNNSNPKKLNDKHWKIWREEFR